MEVDLRIESKRPHVEAGRQQLDAEERAAPVNAPFDLSSCCPASEDGYCYNSCTCAGFFQGVLLTCFVCLAGLCESIRSYFASFCQTAEEAQVALLLSTWREVALPEPGAEGYEDLRAAFEHDFQALCPVKAVERQSYTAAEYVRFTVARAHIDRIYPEQLKSKNGLGEDITSFICKNLDSVLLREVLETLVQWQNASADERRGQERYVPDEQYKQAFVDYWSGGKIDPDLWKRSFELLPEEIQEAARDAFFKAHPDLRDRIVQVPRRPIENNAFLIANDEWDRKWKIARSKDAVIFEHRLDPAVINAVREWKPKAE